jgi:hypothetical protein
MTSESYHDEKENIFSQFTNNELDDALNSDLDFDAIVESMEDALPHINLDEMGSLGTRSPSPSASARSSVISVGSKRSRADFDSESECDSEQHAMTKRMVFLTGPESSLSLGHPYQDGDYSTKVIQRDREREGRCQQCGLEIHKLIMTGVGIELQPLTIEGEVLNGSCLLCNPLTEGETTKSKAEKSTVAPKNIFNASRKSHDTDDGPEPGRASRRASQSPPPPPRGNNMGPHISNRPPPPHQQQSQQAPNLPVPQDALSRRSGKLTPTPNQFHSKMALAKQAQQPRKHSSIEHARLAFPPPLGDGIGMWAQLTPDDSGSSIGNLSSISRAEVERLSVLSSGNVVEKDDNFSRASHRGQNSTGGGGGSSKSMGIGMGIQCTETIPDSEHNLNTAQQQWSTTSHPQTPHSLRRSPSDPPASAQTPQAETPQAQTPQSFPLYMSESVLSSSGRTTLRTPLSVPANLNNRILPILEGGGVVQTTKSMCNMQDFPTSTGTVNQAVRVAHSKLQSSIYHHHIFPVDEETERAHIEKTLVYLETEGGDICDIVVAMRRFPFCLAVQRSACDKLYAHCFDQEHAHAIGLVGGIRTIIDAMEHHPNDAELQLACTDVIKHLAMASTYNTDMLDRMGTVAIIISTMERHSKNATLLESCCWAIERLTQSQSPDLKLRLAKSGGIHATMKAVETFPNNESLLRAAFHCLRQLGYNPSTYGANKRTLLHQQRQAGSNPQPQQVPSNILRGGSGGGGGGGGMPPQGGMIVANSMQNHMSANNMQHTYMMGDHLMTGSNSNRPMMGNNSNNMMGNNNNTMMGNNNPMGNNNNRRMYEEERY